MNQTLDPAPAPVVACRARLSPTMVRELRSIDRFGEASDPAEWHGANGLWWNNRERVLDALRARGLIEHGDCLQLTDAGREALRQSEAA